MREEDRPPERIWLNDEELSNHFAAVRERRGGGSDNGEWEQVPTLEQNELTKGLKRGD